MVVMRMNKLEIWTPEEAGLLNEMKSRCLNGGNYKDEKAKEKFKMLCHLEDYGIEFYEGEKEIERLNNIIDELEQEMNEILKEGQSGDDFEDGYDACLKDFLQRIKELKQEN